MYLRLITARSASVAPLSCAATQTRTGGGDDGGRGGGEAVSKEEEMVNGCKTKGADIVTSRGKEDRSESGAERHRPEKRGL